MTDLVLFSAPGTCARVPCIALEEAGAEYALRLVRFMKGEHRSPEFLALNPRGKVPTLLVGGQPLTVNEHAKLTRFQHLKLTHPLWCKALRRAALI